MTRRQLTSFAGGLRGVRRAEHDRHAAHGGDGELEALPAPQPGRMHDLHFGKLVIPAAHAVNGVGAELDAAPEFSDFELRSWRNENKYMSIAARPYGIGGVVR